MNERWAVRWWWRCDPHGRAMKDIACRELSAALRDEWRHIGSQRRSRDQLEGWSQVEPDLVGLGSLQEVVDVIAVPVGVPLERSVAVTQAVIRLAQTEPLARRLLLQVMAPILVKEMFRTLAVLRLAKVEYDVDDSEVISVVLGSATDAIASAAGSTLEWPLRNLHRRLTKRLVRRREKLIAEVRERLEFLPEQDSVASTPEQSPAVLLAQTLELAVSRGIVSGDDARLVWASTFHGKTSFTLAEGDQREAERLRKRRTRAQQRLAARRTELVEVIAG